MLFVQPMGAECERLYGASCFVAHRADLLALLQQALPGPALQLDRRCTGVQMRGDEVAIDFESRAGQRATLRADMVIGADGIHSRLRQAIAPQVQARFSGLCAFRCLVPAARAPALALRPVQSLWLGPGRHFVHYPISAGRWVNLVAIVPAGDWRTESWTAEGEVADLAREFDGWDERVLALIGAATDTKRWALYDREPLAQWVDGRLALLGDAAHPMLPFFAQGAAQAIEDAAVLAGCLRAATPQTVVAALRRYEALRRPRATPNSRAATPWCKAPGFTATTSTPTCRSDTCGLPRRSAAPIRSIIKDFPPLAPLPWQPNSTCRSRSSSTPSRRSGPSKATSSPGC